jgi:hypothetical protein
MLVKRFAAILRLLGGCVAIFGALLLWLAWGESRLPYEDGRYFDGISVHLEQTVEAYVAVAVLAFVVAALSIWWGRNLARS